MKIMQETVATANAFEEQTPFDIERELTRLDASDLYPYQSCRCARLGWLLTDDVDVSSRYSGHLCLETAHATCTNWMVDSVFPDHHAKRVNLQFATGRFTDARTINEWPIPLYGESNYIFAVIRQFVVESSEDTRKQLATKLARHEGWAQLIEQLRAVAADARGIGSSDDHSIDLEEYRDSNNRWRGVPGALVALGRAGLPQTQATARYAISQIDHIDRGIPSRGFLVTSLCIASQEFCDWAHHQNSPRQGARTEQIVSGDSHDLAWTTDDMGFIATRIGKQHRDWWAGLNGVRLSDGEIRGRRPTLGRDDLKDDVARYRRGELSRKDLNENEIRRSPEDSDRGKALTRVRTQINAQKKRENKT